MRAHFLIIWKTISKQLFCAVKSSARIVKKKIKKSNAEMPPPYGGISFVLFLFLCFINFGIERTNTNRFGVRIVRKTKQKKLKAVKEKDFFDVTSSYAGEGDRYDGKKKRKKAFKRNKVAPAVGKEEAWSKTNGKVVDEPSSTVGADLMPAFVDVLTPPTTDNFNAFNSDSYLGSTCDLFCPEDDIPGPSGVGVKNEVNIDCTDGNDWLDTGKRTKKKSALSNFLSKFKRGPSHQRS